MQYYSCLLTWCEAGCVTVRRRGLGSRLKRCQPDQPDQPDHRETRHHREIPNGRKFQMSETKYKSQEYSRWLTIAFDTKQRLR